MHIVTQCSQNHETIAPNFHQFRLDPDLISIEMMKYRNHKNRNYRTWNHGTIYIWLCTENIYILQLSILSLNAQVDSNFFHQFRSDPDFIYEYIFKSFVEYYFILENIQIIFGI